MSRKTQILSPLASLCTGVAFTPSPAAYAQHVFVQTTSGVSVFNTNMKLVGNYTPKGTLLENDGLLAGTNGKYLITVDDTPGTPYLYSYAVSSSGAIGKEVSSIYLHTWSWWGGQAEVSPNGKNVYFVTEAGDYSFLSFSLSSEGKLSFQGLQPVDEGGTGYTRALYWDILPVITGNDKFAYVTETNQLGYNTIFGFKRESDGYLDYIGFSETDPVAPGSGNAYYPLYIASDPANHLAVLLNDFENDDNPYQVATYTVGSGGDIVSTNTWEDMPSVGATVGGLTINPAGDILAVATTPGIQFFHFDGAKPVTAYTGVIGTSGWIISMAWSGNTLYAVNGASGKLHVYDVSTSKVVEAKGSPYSIGAFSVFVK